MLTRMNYHQFHAFLLFPIGSKFQIGIALWIDFNERPADNTRNRMFNFKFIIDLNRSADCNYLFDSINTYVSYVTMHRYR